VREVVANLPEEFRISEPLDEENDLMSSNEEVMGDLDDFPEEAQA